MLEIVFTDSAAGSLTEALKQNRSTDLGSRSEDVFCLPLCLDIGPIAGEAMSDERLDVLRRLFSVYPIGSDAAEQMFASAGKALDRLAQTAPKGDPIRIWYGDAPDEMCGLLWFADVLQKMTSHGQVHLVHVPAWEERADGTVVQHVGCDELAPEEWESYVRFSREAPRLLIAGFQFDWSVLQQENAGLRAVVSGKVLSVPDSFYDFLINDALQHMQAEFPEALLIGYVLGHSQIGMSDAWLAARIQAMIDAGRLTVCKEPAGDSDGIMYERVLSEKPADA